MYASNEINDYLLYENARRSISRLREIFFSTDEIWYYNNNLIRLRAIGRCTKNNLSARVARIISCISPSKIILISDKHARVLFLIFESFKIRCRSENVRRDDRLLYRKYRFFNTFATAWQWVILMSHDTSSRNVWIYMHTPNTHAA